MVQVKKGPPQPEPDTTYVFSRSEDRSVLAHIAYLKDKFFIIWAPALALIMAMGFGFKTPAQTTAILQAQIDSTTRKMKELDSVQHRMEQKIDMILKINCLAVKIPQKDLILAGLDCSRITLGIPP